MNYCWCCGNFWEVAPHYCKEDKLTAPITQTAARKWAVDKLDKLIAQIPWCKDQIPYDLETWDKPAIVDWFLKQGHYTKATVLAVRHALARENL